MMVRIIGIAGLGAALFVLLLINGTTPSTVGPLGILAVFLCMYVILVSTLTLILWQGSYILQRVAKGLTVRRPLRVLTLRRAYYFSSVIGLAPVILIAMQSVGRVGFYEVGLVSIFVLIGCVYVAKRSI